MAGVPDVGEVVVQKLDDIAADGDIFGVRFVVVDAEEVAEVFERERAIDDVGAVLPLSVWFFGIVLFVPDLADDLLQNVFHRDEAFHSAIFVHDQGEMALLLFESLEDIVDFGRTREAKRGLEQVSQGEVCLLDSLNHQAACPDVADDVVDRAFIDGDAAELVCLGVVQDVLDVVFDVDGEHVHARRHDFIGFRVGVADGLVEKGGLLFVDHALLFDALDHFVKIVLADLHVLDVPDERGADDLAEAGDEIGDGQGDIAEDENDFRIEDGKAIVENLSERFGDDFAKDDLDDKTDDRGD